MIVLYFLHIFCSIKNELPIESPNNKYEDFNTLLFVSKEGYLSQIKCLNPPNV